VDEYINAKLLGLYTARSLPEKAIGKRYNYPKTPSRK
jgi:hypothetical protein